MQDMDISARLYQRMLGHDFRLSDLDAKRFGYAKIARQASSS